MSDLVRLLLIAVLLTCSMRAVASPTDDVQAGLAARGRAPAEARADFERAAAGADSIVAAEALYQLADMDEDDLAFAAALDRYRASLLRAPQSRYAPRAETRIDYLRRHAEGDFAPLVRLEHVRRDAHFADQNAIDALAKDADAFPPGRVRIEAWLVVGDAYQRRLDRPDDALHAYRQILSDEKADPLSRQQAAHDAVDILTARGDYAGALEAAAPVEAYDASLAAKVRRLALRARLRKVAKSILVLLLALSVAAIGWGIRKRPIHAAAQISRFSRVALAFALYVAVAGAVLASSYEGGSVKPFFALGGAIFLIAILARAWSAFGSSHRVMRGARMALCGVSILAAAVLLLDRIDPAYLDSFGL